MADVVEDLAQSLSTLRPRGVVHHVLCHEVVEHMVVPGDLSSKELFYDCLRFCHPPRLPDASAGGQPARAAVARRTWVKSEKPHLASTP